jgi:hypothetical protein
MELERDSLKTLQLKKLEEDTRGDKKDAHWLTREDCDEKLRQHYFDVNAQVERYRRAMASTENGQQQPLSSSTEGEGGETVVSDGGGVEKKRTPERRNVLQDLPPEKR